MDYEQLKGPNPRAIFIAEAGINHDGDLQEARRMVDAAVEAGADYVKFQSFKADRLVTPRALTSTYIDAGSRKGETFRDLLRRLELSDENQKELRDYCNSRRIKFLSTPFHEESVDALLGLGVDVIKVASGDLTNLPMLRHMASSGLPMIVSTGMATLGEIEEAIDAIVRAGNDRIVLMHCISWYPAAIETTNLRYMETLRSAFGFPVGYSDHTLGITMTVAARALGAVVLEKHFTMDSARFGPDHAASIEPQQMVDLVRGIREVEAGLGSPVRSFDAKEIGQRKVHRRSIIVNQAVRKGEPLTLKNLVMKRPGTGIMPKHLEVIVGRRATKDLAPEHILEWTDIG